jgi:cytochrome c oxidase subunit 2
MRLAVIADTPEQYEEWLRKQAAPASTPQTDEERRGAAVFERAACPLCHQIRGTGAHGTVGPDLTHLASRSRIAGGMLEKNRGTLTGWVAHAQAIKPGSQMPDLPDFNEDDLTALVIYLQSLR